MRTPTCGREHVDTNMWMRTCAREHAHANTWNRNYGCKHVDANMNTCRVAESTMQTGTVDSRRLQRLQPGMTEPTVQTGRGYRAESQSTDCRMAESSYSTELTELQRL